MVRQKGIIHIVQFRAFVYKRIGLNFGEYPFSYLTAQELVIERVCTRKICQEMAPRLEHATDLAQSLLDARPPQMVNGRGGKHRIESQIGPGEGTHLRHMAV